MRAPGRRIIALAGLTLAACGKPQSMGEPTELLVGTSPAMWEAIEEDVLASLEPRTFTVRDEQIFDVAHRDPAGDEWRDLRLMRQIVLVGSTEDPAVTEAIAASNSPAPPPPALFQAQNVWALNQSVSVVLLAPGSEPAAARPLLDQLSRMLVEQLESYAAARMFATGSNVELADSLRRNAGFSLELPNVYRFEEREPDTFIFRNDQPDPATLIRNITVASRPADEARLTPEAVTAWREELAARFNTPSQLTDTVTLGSSTDDAVSVEGVWTNPPDEWPAGGTFISRGVKCGERVFLLDAWLYAPGAPKYEYDFQLRRILDSFTCAG